MSEAFKPKVGDLVRLKSGGPTMTVVRQDTPTNFECCWFRRGHLLRDTFVENALEPIATTPKLVARESGMTFTPFTDEQRAAMISTMCEPFKCSPEEKKAIDEALGKIRAEPVGGYVNPVTGATVNIVADPKGKVIGHCDTTHGLRLTPLSDDFLAAADIESETPIAIGANQVSRPADEPVGGVFKIPGLTGPIPPLDGMGSRCVRCGKFWVRDTYKGVLCDSCLPPQESAKEEPVSENLADSVSWFNSVMGFQG